MDKSSLPEGWGFKRLCDVAKYINGAAFKPSDWSTKGLPIIRIQNLTDKSRPFNYFEGELDSKYRVNNGDLLISWSATVDVFVWDSSPAWLNQHIFRVEENPNIVDKRYLVYVVKWVLSKLRAKTHGLTMKHIRRKPFENTLIPVPPLSEQRRIVARIKQLTSRLEKARAFQKQAVEEAEVYLASMVSNIFDEGISKGWEIKKVKQICEKPQYGYTESATTVQVGPKFLRITDIQNGSVNWNTVPYCKCNELEKYRLSRGDILFARTGATTGKSYLVSASPEAVFASYLIRLRPTDKILPEFLFWYFQSSSYWHAVYSGTEDGNRPNMNGTKLAKLEIPFPRDKSHQRRIVKHFESVQAKAEQLKRLQAETEAELESFMPALLAKAFRGEL